MIDDGSYDIKEAITDPFEANDRCNELISKNRSVTLADKVSRLRNVGRNGKLRKRLEHEKIMTVKDFLDRLSSNPVALQKIYGSTGKRWEVTVRHAKTSISDKKCNVCGSVGSTTQESDEASQVDQNPGTELGLFEASPSSNDMMSMTFDQLDLDQYFESAVSYLDLSTNL
ncbi:calmodulin-binding protein 60 A-like [Bidens hawaiensis]|uniref:calmodulin-binding protein 60 A-like n=1 Tax=Bidens hawaiensis TaxID=980011 RepID=UPI004049B05E